MRRLFDGLDFGATDIRLDCMMGTILDPGAAGRSTLGGAVTLAAGLTTIVLLLRLVSRVRGTTLVAPASWAIVATALITIVELSQRTAGNSSSAAQLLRYVAAAATCCPSMALLGAKRPQHRGWQFIVVTLWMVLVLPAIQPYVFARSSHFQLHESWRGFLLVLTVISVTNYLPTRYAPAALIAGAGQLLLLSPYLPFVHRWSPHWYGQPIPSIAVVSAALALFGIASAVLMRRDAAAGTPTPAGWNRVWLDFRDAFGAVWAIRVRERINQAAESEGARLDWDGFESAERQCQLSETLETAIRTSLRRFVSSEWIDTRLK